MTIYALATSRLHTCAAESFGTAQTACQQRLAGLAYALVLAPDATTAQRLAGGAALCDCAKTA